MNLNTDQIDIEATTEGVIIEPTYLGYLRSQGYNIDEIKDVQTVGSESRDVTHLVMKVETTDKPQGHPELDVVADKTELRVCSCENYQYSQSVDVSKKTLAEGSIGSCKHLIAAYRTEQAKADPNQQAIFDTGQ